MFWCFEKDCERFLAISFLTSSRQALRIFSRAALVSISFAQAFLTRLNVRFSYPNRRLRRTITSSYRLTLGLGPLLCTAAVFAREAPVKLSYAAVGGLGKFPSGIAAVLGLLPWLSCPAYEPICLE